MLMDFTNRYQKLNVSQKIAVDTIDGPVMVIAGPGTGKTELLSVRTANILQKTDTLPENILCLTFTDSGASAMRERLTSIIGKDAYKVAVHTFHSFGSEVINQNGQFFYQGAHFMPANELSSYEIMQSIFSELDYANPLAGKLNDEFTYLSDSVKAISELKKSGLTSDELLIILDKNNAVIEKVEQLLSPIFDNRISKKTADELSKNIEAISLSGEDNLINSTVPLSKVISDSLIKATSEAVENNSTKPITAWRNYWFKKDQTGHFILKTKERQKKLRELSFVYEKYLTRMQEASLYDYDDMILRVVHAMEVFHDLRFNLQEKYQYIMVDEFQDTNMAQMRILHNLTNNEAQGDTPNILVVGDDDQAIYSFQGADISNIIDFRTNYPKAKVITLTENYRSNDKILNGSRDIITQGNNRLESIFNDIDKKLISKKINDGDVVLYEAENTAEERHYIVNKIKSNIKSGTEPNNIAVLTRRHHEINSLLPYFSKAGIAVNYERRDNILEIPLVLLIEKISRLLINIQNGRHDEINSALPEILANKAWGIPAVEIWKLSVKSYDGRLRWLDAMETSPAFKLIRDWLIETSALALETPLEQMLDIIIGHPNISNSEITPDIYISPIYKYYFSDDRLKNDANEYLTYLEALRTIRSELKEYHPNQKPNLKTFTDYISLNRKINRTISSKRNVAQSKDAVNIMTTHKSKGLEFEDVYILNAIDSVWGEKARSRNSLINYPENLPLSPAGETEDERLRLFYVAATRAKKHLNISYSLRGDNNKDTVIASFLLDSKWDKKKIPQKDEAEQIVEAAELDWYQPIIKPIDINMKKILISQLDNYKLSVTHLHSFLDITRGGPATFLLNNLLKFPQAKSPNAVFGTAIHETLQKSHAHLVSTGKIQAIEDIVSNFEINLSDQHMTKKDYDKFLEKGSNALRLFLEKKYQTFNTSQKTELNFSNQNSIVGEAHLTGKLDLVDINIGEKTFKVTDYKTGRPSSNWTGKDEFEKIKLHKYKQQLLFYKLLVENSRDYHSFNVDTGVMQFVEPTPNGQIIDIDTEFDVKEMERFVQLINAVWKHITEINLPDISKYDSTYKGILKFEQDLIDNIT